MDESVWQSISLTIYLFIPALFIAIVAIECRDVYKRQAFVGIFFIWAFPFIKIPSNHIGNFRKAVIFIAVEYVF